VQARLRLLPQRPVQALGNLGVASDDASDALLRTLTDSDEHSEVVRAEAADALGHIGPPADSALPMLQELLTDDEVRVRETAAEAIASRQ